MLILGGAGPPPEVLPGALGTLGSLIPLRPAVVAIQDPWIAGGWSGTSLAVLVGIGLGSVAVAAARLRQE